MIEQQFIELRTRDLISAITIRSITVLEIKLHASRPTGGDDFTTELRKKCAIDFFAHTQPIECLGAERQERFADVEARKFLALKHDDAAPGPGQQGRGG